MLTDSISHAAFMPTTTNKQAEGRTGINRGDDVLGGMEKEQFNRKKIKNNNLTN